MTIMGKGRRKVWVLMLMGMLLCQGCELFDVHPYDTHFSGEKDINRHNIERIRQAFTERDTLRVVFTGDTQGWLDDTEDMVGDINKRADIDFLIHLGDLTNYGETQEFVWQRDLLNKLAVPYVCIIGNHDCLGNGEAVFRTMFGELNFSFIAGRVKFVCMNTNAMEYDYSNPVPDFNFMKREWTADSTAFDRTVLCMHARPGTEQFNNNVEEPFRYYCDYFPRLMFCAAAHEHTPKVVDYYNNGTIYYVTPNVARRSYYLFTITPEGYSYETIYF